MNKAQTPLLPSMLLTALLMAGCQSPPAAPENVISRSYQVTATYQLVIKDESGAIVHHTDIQKSATSEHDVAVVFSEDARVKDLIQDATSGLNHSVSNMVGHLKTLPAYTPPQEHPENVTHSESNAAEATPRAETNPPTTEQAPNDAQASTPPPAPEHPSPLITPTQIADNATAIRVKKVSGNTITVSKHPSAVVGARFFVRGQPEVILDPFTGEERRISDGTVYGVGEIQSVGLFSIKAKLLSGTAEKGSYLEALEPTDGK